MNIPDTNPVPDEIRGLCGPFLQADPFDNLQAVVDAALEAATRGDIDVPTAGIIIEFGIKNAKASMYLRSLKNKT